MSAPGAVMPPAVTALRRIPAAVYDGTDMAVTILARVQLLVFCLLILGFLALFLLRNSSRDNLSTRLYLVIIAALGFSIATEVLSWITDGSADRFRALNYWFNAVTIGLSSLPTVAWFLYGDYKIYQDAEGLKKRVGLYLLPAVVILGMMVVNHVRPGFIFELDAANRYVRGRASAAIPLTLYAASAAVLVYLFRRPSMINGRVTLVILLYLLLPFAGSLIQIFVEGISLNWAMYTYAVLLTFFLLEKTEMNRDALTNLPSRDQFMRRLEYDIRSGKSFTLVMADLNDFKAINDRFGHQEGDRVLSYTAALLQSHTTPEDLVCRYGGDEFMMLLESEVPDLAERLVRRIDAALADHNAALAGYRISLSFGWSFVDDSGADAAAILTAVDQAMYADKARRKAAGSPALS